MKKLLFLGAFALVVAGLANIKNCTTDACYNNPANYKFNWAIGHQFGSYYCDAKCMAEPSKIIAGH